MNKKLILVAVVLTFSLLTACGKTDTKAEDHSGHGAEKKTDDHSGHGAASDKSDNPLKAAFSFEAGTAKAKEDTELTIQITGEDGAPINEFDENHEKLLHLIVVNHDLSYFNHIHPEFQGDGKFNVTTSFPAGGDYKLFADFIPTGGSGVTLSEWVKVDGEEAQHTAVKADAKLAIEVDGKAVELNLSSKKANEDVTLTYNIRDAKTNKDIDNLEQYLGAVGHVVILSDDAEQYLHVHPIDEKATGPEAKFATSFPHSGTYKVWGQFQQNGEVFTVPFVVDIQ
ncbi:hypothetical protein [Paenibacillus mendelii]|uniref:Secreted protein n=1 Tax=Paenibacillus mendelii TaxID=206163 RepID=A0ABV6JE11_9BACL|nr:hypothetical protein [Paenibacillus mendelii]MCQ6563830.1 hypothetical protein [Paenibacillus mendelii]